MNSQATPLPGSACTTAPGGSSFASRAASAFASSSSFDTDEDELPAANNRPSVGLLAVRELDRLVMRPELDAHVPVGDSRLLRVLRLVGLTALVLRLVLGLGRGERRARVLPPFLLRVPAVELEADVEPVLGGELPDERLGRLRAPARVGVDDDPVVGSAHGDAFAGGDFELTVCSVVAQHLQQRLDAGSRRQGSR